MLRDYEHLHVIWSISHLTLKKFDEGWFVGVLGEFSLCITQTWELLFGREIWTKHSGS